MKKLSLIFTAAAALLLLSGCRTVVVSPDDPGNMTEPRISAANAEQQAEQLVTAACRFVFDGDESRLTELTDDRPAEIRMDMKDAIMDMQEDLLGGDRTTRSLSLDGVPALLVINDYADKVLDGLSSIKDYEVTDVSTVGDRVFVNVSLTPLQAVDSALTGVERLRALKDFTPKAAQAPVTFTLRLELERRGVEFDDDSFEELAVHALD